MKSEDGRSVKKGRKAAEERVSEQINSKGSWGPIPLEMLSETVGAPLRTVPERRETGR